MAQKRGIISALFRFLANWNWKKARSIDDATNQMWTQDAQSVQAGYDIALDEARENMASVRDAVAKFMSNVDRNQERLTNLNTEQAELEQVHNGILAAIEQMQADGTDDSPDTASATEEFNQVQIEIERCQAESDALETQLKEDRAKLEDYKLDLQRMQAKIVELEKESVDAVVQKELNDEREKIADQLAGLQTSFDQGPIDAIRKANRDQKSRVKITEELGGIDSDRRREKFKRAGSKVAGNEKLQAMLEKRKSEREGPSTDATAPTTSESEDRAQI